MFKVSDLKPHFLGKQTFENIEKYFRIFIFTCYNFWFNSCLLAFVFFYFLNYLTIFVKVSIRYLLVFCFCLCISIFLCLSVSVCTIPVFPSLSFQVYFSTYVCLSYDNRFYVIFSVFLSVFISIYLQYMSFELVCFAAVIVNQLKQEVCIFTLALHSHSVRAIICGIVAYPSKI